MRDKTHMESVERWARYVRENPDRWKSKVKPIIDSQIIKSRSFYKKLLKTEGGKEKLKKLRNIDYKLMNQFKKSPENIEVGKILRVR